MTEQRSTEDVAREWYALRNVRPWDDDVLDRDVIASLTALIERERAEQHAATREECAATAHDAIEDGDLQRERDAVYAAVLAVTQAETK